MAILAIAFVALAARLAQGPLDLGYFKPQLESALTESLGGGISVRRFALRAADGEIALSAFGVVLAGDDRKTIGHAEEIKLSLQPNALLRGKLRPQRLTVVGAELVAERGPDGQLKLLATATDDRNGGDLPPMDILEIVERWIAGDVDTKRLPDIRLETVTVTARVAGTGEVLWRGQAAAELTLSGEEINIWAAIGLDRARPEPPLRIAVALVRDRGGDVTANFTNAKLSGIAEAIGLLGLKLPPLSGRIDGDLAFTFDAKLKPGALKANLSGAGLRGDFDGMERIAIERADVELRADIPARTLIISGFRIGGDRPILIGAGAVRPEAAGPEGGDVYQASGRLDHVDGAALARLLGLDDALKGVSISAAADFDVTVRDGAFVSAETRISGSGAFRHPDFYAEPLALSAASGFAAYDAATRTFSLSGLTGRLDGVAVAGEGRFGLTAAGAIETASAFLKTGAFDIAKLVRLWPKSLAPGGRVWIAENITAGTLTEADFEFQQTAGAPMKVSGSFAGKDLAIRYWPPLPPVTGVSGRGRFFDDVIEIKVDRGVIGAMKTNQATVRIYDLGAKREMIAVDSAVQGPADALLTILNRPPLRYAEWLGIDPTKARGAVDGRIKLKFPLIDALQMADIDLVATGAIAKAFVPKAVNGWDLAAKRLAIKVTPQQLDVGGVGTLLDQPVSFDGVIAFGPGDERARFTGDWRLTRAVRQALGIGGRAISRRLTGATPATFDIVVRPRERYEIAVVADLTDATLLAQEIGWIKPKGRPASVKSKIILENGAPVRIDGIALRAADLEMDADIQFADGEIRRVGVRRLLGAGHDLRAEILLGDSEESVRISGKRMDLRPLFKLDAPPKDAVAGRNGLPAPAMRRVLTISTDAARLTKHLELANLKASATVMDDWPVALAGAAQYPGGALAVGTNPADDNQIVLTASDFGKLLAAANVTAGVADGPMRLTIDRARDDSLSLDLRVRDFTVSKTALSRFAGGKSGGLVDSLSRTDHIAFDRIGAIGRYAGGQLTLSDGRLSGDALGVSARGIIDFRQEFLDISGAITPAYGFSRILAAIPVLGALLTGAKREGLFAANYKAFGALDDPEFEVNALSALAPGILRDAFSGPRAPAAPSQTNNDP